jgi:hypothetical protein
LEIGALEYVLNSIIALDDVEVVKSMSPLYISELDEDSMEAYSLVHRRSLRPPRSSFLHGAASCRGLIDCTLSGQPEVEHPSMD